jgi:hypothetical protein
VTTPLPSFSSSNIYLLNTDYLRWGKTIPYADTQPWGPSPIKKEREAMSTKEIIAKERAERTKSEVKKALEIIEPTFDAITVPGACMTWEVKFPDKDTVYHYAVIYGSNNRWYKTYSTSCFTTAELIDEMVRIEVESESFIWNWK